MKFLSHLTRLIPKKSAAVSETVEATPEMLAASIVYAAGAHLRGIETNLRQYQTTLAQILPLPDLESDAGFRVLEESIIALCALTLDRIWEHRLGSPAMEEYSNCFLSELVKLGSGCGVSLTDKNLAEACLLYSSYSSAPATKEEVLADYADYIFEEDIGELDDAALPSVIFHARVLRALGVRDSVNPLLCTGLLAVNGGFLKMFRGVLTKTKPKMG